MFDDHYHLCKVNYYAEAIKLYYYNCILFHEYDRMMHETYLLRQQYHQIIGAEYKPTRTNKKIKRRRCASDITKEHSCPYPGCIKKYGSEGSLSQHVKLKHEEFIKDYFAIRKVNGQ